LGFASWTRGATGTRPGASSARAAGGRNEPHDIRQNGFVAGIGAHGRGDLVSHARANTVGGQGRTERIIASRERRRSPVGRHARRPASRRRPRSSRLRAGQGPLSPASHFRTRASALSPLPSGRTLQGVTARRCTSAPGTPRSRKVEPGVAPAAVHRLESLPGTPLAPRPQPPPGGGSYANASAPRCPTTGARRGDAEAEPGAVRPKGAVRPAERNAPPHRSAVRPRDGGAPTPRSAVRRKPGAGTGRSQRQAGAARGLSRGRRACRWLRCSGGRDCARTALRRRLWRRRSHCTSAFSRASRCSMSSWSMRRNGAVSA